MAMIGMNSHIEAFPLTSVHIGSDASCAFISLDAGGRIVRVNETFCTWSGRIPAEIVGKYFFDFVESPGTGASKTPDRSGIPPSAFDGEILDLLTSAGDSLPVLARSSASDNQEGESSGTEVVLFRAREAHGSIGTLAQALETERQIVRRLRERIAAVERQIEETTAEETEVREYSELQGQFIAVLGHDLRNPVAAIDSGAAILLREGWTDRAPLILNLMRNSVVRMNGLINNVLDLTRFRLGGGIDLKLEPGRPLAPTLQQVAEEIRTAHPNRTIHDRIEVDGTVAVDHLRIAQSYSNLLGNALKHGAADRPVHCECRVLDGLLEITVRNSGNPIPPDLMDRLFKPFHRGEVHHNSGGLGLGLYIAAQIAEAHGGRIVASSDDLETRFSLLIPCAPSIPPAR
jgi:sigma-B regulation protein RsbU (phosphoserine phosphatase)